MRIVQRFTFEVPLSAVNEDGPVGDMVTITIERDDAIELAQALNEALGTQPAVDPSLQMLMLQAAATRPPEPVPALDPRLADWAGAQLQEQEPAPLPPGVSVKSGGIGARPL